MKKILKKFTLRKLRYKTLLKQNRMAVCQYIMYNYDAKVTSINAGIYTDLNATANSFKIFNY